MLAFIAPWAKLAALSPSCGQELWGSCSGILELGWEVYDSTPCLDAWYREPFGRQKGFITPCGQTLTAPRKTSQGRQGREPWRVPSFQELGSPALPVPAVLICALLCWVQHLENNIHNILMSREELVSQKSLKYDHM